MVPSAVQRGGCPLYIFYISLDLCTPQMSRLKTSKTVKHCENQRLLQIHGGQVWMQRAPGKGTNTIKYVPSSLETGMGDLIGNRQSQTIIDNRFKTRFDPQFCKEWKTLKNNEQHWKAISETDSHDVKARLAASALAKPSCWMAWMILTASANSNPIIWHYTCLDVTCV